MKRTALIEEANDGSYYVFTADTESTVVGTGPTIEEAIADFELALKECEDYLPELNGVEFEYKEYKEEE